MAARLLLALVWLPAVVPLDTAQAGLSLLWPTPIYARRSPQTRAAAAAMRPVVALLSKSDPGVRKSNKDSNGWHSSELLGEGALTTHRRLEPADAAASIQATGIVEGAVRDTMRSMLAAMGTARFGLLLGLAPTDELADDATIHVQNIWANVNNQSDYNIMHTHPNSVFSGALYIDADAEAGQLEFADPRPLVQCPRTDDPQTRTSLFMVCAWCPERLCARGTGLVPRRLLDAGASKHIAPSPGLLLLWPSWLPHRVAPQPLNRSRVSISFNIWVERRQNQATRSGHSSTTSSLDPAVVASQRKASEDFLSLARDLGRQGTTPPSAVMESIGDPIQSSAQAADVAENTTDTLTLHWPTWVHEATLKDATRNMKELKFALKAWADTRVAEIAAGRELKGDVSENVFAPPRSERGSDHDNDGTRSTGTSRLIELKQWIAGVASNVSARLTARDSHSPVADSGARRACAQVERVRAVLVRQPPDTLITKASGSSARLPLPTPAWVTSRPQIAGLFVVNARCKTTVTTSEVPSPPFAVDVHDPRPEAGVIPPLNIDSVSL
jgi:hypothetical protein